MQSHLAHFEVKESSTRSIGLIDCSYCAPWPHLLASLFLKSGVFWLDSNVKMLTFGHHPTLSRNLTYLVQVSKKKPTCTCFMTYGFLKKVTTLLLLLSCCSNFASSSCPVVPKCLFFPSTFDIFIGNPSFQLVKRRTPTSSPPSSRASSSCSSFQWCVE